MSLFALLSRVWAKIWEERVRQCWAYDSAHIRRVCQRCFHQLNPCGRCFCAQNERAGDWFSEQTVAGCNLSRLQRILKFFSWGSLTLLREMDVLCCWMNGSCSSKQPAPLFWRPYKVLKWEATSDPLVLWHMNGLAAFQLTQTEGTTNLYQIRETEVLSVFKSHTWRRRLVSRQV